MESIVFAAYETEITTGILENISETYNISSGSISIDNTNHDLQYPSLTITSSSSTITEVSIGGNSVQLNKSISTGDTLILDFEEQEYTLNGVSIVEDLTFLNRDTPLLQENSQNTILISHTNSITVDVGYKKYNDIIVHSYVQDFRLSVDRSYNTDKKFKKTKKNNLILSDENYNVSFSNMAFDWEFYNAIENDVPVRITYNETHTNGDKVFNKYLTGVKFNTYERYYRDSTGILFESLVGEGINLF